MFACHSRLSKHELPAPSAYGFFESSPGKEGTNITKHAVAKLKVVWVSMNGQREEIAYMLFIHSVHGWFEDTPSGV